MYRMELYIDIISTTEETVSSNHHGVREHVTFSIVAKQILDKMSDPPPTFIAQTKKHGEQQILHEVLLQTCLNQNLFRVPMYKHDFILC